MWSPAHTSATPLHVYKVWSKRRWTFQSFTVVFAETTCVSYNSIYTSFEH